MRRMPGLTGAIVPGAGHIAAMDQPDDVNGRVFEGAEAPVLENRDVPAFVLA